MKLTENTIEQSLIDQLIGQGYTYFNGTDIAPYLILNAKVLLLYCLKSILKNH